MRSYPRNSPEAAARILALVLVADGHVCRSEFEVLEQVGAAAALGLPPQALPQIVHALCEDLLMQADASGSLMSGVDESVVAALLDEVDDPVLQRQVLDLSMAAASADRHVADGETWVIEAALRRWQPLRHAA